MFTQQRYDGGADERRIVPERFDDLGSVYRGASHGQGTRRSGSDAGIRMSQTRPEGYQYIVRERVLVSDKRENGCYNVFRIAISQHPQSGRYG